MKAYHFLAIAVLSAAACAQWKQAPSTGSPEYRLPDRTTLAGQSGLGPLLAARLLDEEQNARGHRAVIAVSTDGVHLTDGRASSGEPKNDEAHIAYRVDGSSIKYATSSTWTVENLHPGTHLIHIWLAAADNRQVGMETTLKVNIPGSR